MVAKGKDHGRYKHGFRAGYTEWRYGDIRVQKRQEPILDKPRYDSAVLRAGELLRQWMNAPFPSTPFQFEATIRHGLRQQFCLKGFSWDRSDIEAERIVAEALRDIGARRPSHDEGQPEYVVSQDYCTNCYSPLDDEQIARHQRFCCTECAKATMERRNFEVGYWADQIGQAAFRMVQRAKHAPRQCSHCNKEFRPASDESEQRFCSLACSSASQRTVPDKPCATCGTMFRPHSTGRGNYCSRACKDKALTLVVVERECQFCGHAFTARAKKAAFCSTACAVSSSKIGRGWSPKQITPHVFDHYLTMPINASRPAWLTPERFDELVAA